uniref:Uncharacterized protein n=1 Tax=Glossina pallidipes TaxID=7398 RepID=A0A1A9Z5A4_GLOPL
MAALFCINAALKERFVKIAPCGHLSCSYSADVLNALNKRQAKSRPSQNIEENLLSRNGRGRTGYTKTTTSSVESYNNQ